MDAWELHGRSYFGNELFSKSSDMKDEIVSPTKWAFNSAALDLVRSQVCLSIKGMIQTLPKLLKLQQ